MAWASLGVDAPGRGRTKPLTFEVREDREKSCVSFEADKEWAERLSTFCKEIGMSKSAFLRYAAMKEISSYKSA